MAHGHLGLVLRHVRRLIGAETAGHHTDRQLLARFAAQRDESAFTTLVERHGGLVLSVCRRVLGDVHAAEDAFQATFLVLAQRAGSVGWQDSIANWLYGVAHRVAVKAKARAQRRLAHEREAPMPHGDSESRRLLEPAPLVLCYLEGKTNEEAARELGWPAGSMSRHLTRGREILRDRLTSRGVTFAGGVLGVVLTESAAPALVPAPLVASTVHAVLLGAAGQATAGAIAPEVVTLAEGVLKTMLLDKVKLAVFVLLTVATLGLGTGGFLHHVLAAEQDKKDLPRDRSVAEAVPIKEDDKGALAKPAAKTENPARVARQKLAERLDLPKGIEANTPLKEALDFISERHGVQILLDEAAFAEINIQKVGEQPVQLPKMKNVRLATVLRLLLKQVRGDNGYTGGYVVRPDGLEVTTTYNVLREALGHDTAKEMGKAPPGALPAEPGEVDELQAELAVLLAQPLVNVEFDKRTLQDVLRDLSEAEGINIVVDPRVADKVKVPVTATLNNVLFETAVRLLAEMGDLKAVTLDNIHYITTKANADVLQADKAKRKAKPVLPPVGGGPPGP
jgi:DNA-directed RNA polymerase specialized sigma24 family protein